MDIKLDRLRLHELTTQLKEAANAYHNEDREIMPNLAYDRLYDELAALEAQTGIVLAGSPTQRVGYGVVSELAKEAHSQPMLSLNKTKDTQELADWLGEKTGVLTWKLDGLTVALTYSGGQLVKAVTRGDGQIGEVVTEAARAFENLPLRIPYTGELLLRGEAAIRYSDFARINERILDEAAKYKNPRNLASGSVRQLDSAMTAARHVRFHAFALVSASEGEPTACALRSEQLAFLQEQGFETVDSRLVTGATVADEVHGFAERAGASDLPSDGLVLIYDDIAYGESLGSTSKYPRDGIAFKWADELAETTLRGIEWSASRTGLINPVALFDPVEIEGTTVARASVHNVSIMEELALGEGDALRVYKANMIIPQIAENRTRSGTLHPPSTCPVCGAATEVRDSGGVKSLCCPNALCPAKLLGRFAHFVSRGALNIEGLSESTLEKFVAAGFLVELADLFTLGAHRESIESMEGFGARSCKRLLDAVETARHTTRERLLFGLGIPQIGLSNARRIARHFAYDWTRITQAQPDELLLIDGVGGIMAELFSEWFADESNRAQLARLMEHIEFVEESPAASGGQLDGKTVVITGGLNAWANRDALKAAIEQAGGKVTGSVSEKTDYLVNNDSASTSTKNKKAKALGVPILTEEEIGRLLGL